MRPHRPVLGKTFAVAWRQTFETMSTNALSASIRGPVALPPIAGARPGRLLLPRAAARQAYLNAAKGGEADYPAEEVRFHRKSAGSSRVISRNSFGRFAVPFRSAENGR